MVKEQHLERRIALLREKDFESYQSSLDARTKDFMQVQIDMKDIVFDYFNIITKEYEIAYEKWKSNPEYAEAVQKIKDEIDNEFVAKKFEELPPGLTLEKTKTIIDKKQEMINEILMESL